MNTNIRSPSELKTLLRKETLDEQWDSIRKQLMKAGVPEHDLIKKGRIKYDPNKNGKDFIAEGGFGSVYRCAVKGLKGKKVVLKSVLFSLSTLPGIMNEIKCHMLMNDHPYVVTIRKICLELFRDDRPENVAEEYNGYIHIIMDQCEMDLTEYCVKHFDDALAMKLDRFFYQITLALEVLHEKGMIHRDIKPQNILMVRSSDSEKNTWIPLLADFGISTFMDNLGSDESKKSLDSKRSTRTTKTVIGTDIFMAGEMKSGEYDQKVDIYALTIAYYQCKTFYPEFGEQHWATPIELPMTKKMCQSLKFSDEQNFKDWEDLLMIGCHRNPLRRPTSTELRRRLENEQLAAVLGFLDDHGLNIKKNERFWINVFTKILLPSFLIFFVTTWIFVSCPSTEKPKQGLFSHPLFNGCTCACDEKGGQCIEGLDKCNCTLSNYEGPLCKEVHKCENNPCANKGICEVNSGTVSCDCSLTDYSGPNCNVLACYDFDKDPLGIDFVGDHNMALTKETFENGAWGSLETSCMNWDDSTIEGVHMSGEWNHTTHSFDYKKLVYDKVPHNFCRNPNQDENGPWCFLNITRINEDYASYIKQKKREMHLVEYNKPLRFQWDIENIGYCKSLVENCQGVRLCSDDVGIGNWKLDSGTRLNKCRSFTNLQMRRFNISTIPEKYFYDNVNLEILNLAHNRIFELSSILFKPLRVLKTLDLRENLITDLSPDIFKSLQELQTLVLRENLISDLNPVLFKSLTKLTRLDLTDNQIITLPVSLFEANSKIRALSLSFNPIKLLDKNQFISLVNLRVIDLNGMSELEESSLSSEIFKNNVNLKKLYMRQGQFKSLNQNIFATLTKLESIEIGLGRMDGLNKTPDLFRHNVKLTSVSLMAAFWSSKSGPFRLSNDTFSSLVEMTRLDLASNHLDNLPSGLFENNLKLDWLSLTGNEIKLLDKNTFTSLKVLTFLSLWYNKIETLPAELFSKNMELVTLKLSMNKIQFLHPDQFNSLAKLQTLDLSGNPIKQISFNHFSNNLELNFLDLRKTEVEGLNKSDFGVLAKLENLMWDDPAE